VREIGIADVDRQEPHLNTSAQPGCSILRQRVRAGVATAPRASRRSNASLPLCRSSGHRIGSTRNPTRFVRCTATAGCCPVHRRAQSWRSEGRDSRSSPVPQLSHCCNATSHLHLNGNKGDMTRVGRPHRTLV
jgi:hypothetical protein